MKMRWMVLIGCIAAVVMFSAAVRAQESVTVYTALETDEVTKYLEVARKDLPGLQINVTRLSTGELGPRCWPRRQSPGRLYLGWAVTDTEQFVAKGMLEPYKPREWKSWTRSSFILNSIMPASTCTSRPSALTPRC